MKFSLFLRCMPKILEINTVADLDNSVGRIMCAISNHLRNNGMQCFIVTGRGDFERVDYRIGTAAHVYWHAALSRITDSEGRHSKGATTRLVRHIDALAPDVIHLHNLHGHYLHLPTLMGYLAAAGIPVVITLHDLWLTSGHCAHFVQNGCAPWRAGCGRCHYHRSEYPRSIFSRASSNLRLKADLIKALPDVRLVVPSQWMKSMVSQSHLARLPISVIPNGVDTSVFYPPTNTAPRSGILAVAGQWTTFKGLADIIALARSGLVSEPVSVVGNLRRNQLPPQIRYLGSISSPSQLAECYRRARVVVNPSRVESFGMVSVEALACGCNVIANSACGASAEVLAGSGSTLVDTSRPEILANAIASSAAPSSAVSSRLFTQAEMSQAYMQLLTR